MAEMTMFLTSLLVGGIPADGGGPGPVARGADSLDAFSRIVPNGRRGIPSRRKVGEASLCGPQGRGLGRLVSGRGPSRLSPGVKGRLSLGRRRPCDQAPAALASRAVADLVRGGRDPAVLSGPPQRVLDRAPALG